MLRANIDLELDVQPGSEAPNLPSSHDEIINGLVPINQLDPIFKDQANWYECQFKCLWYNTSCDLGFNSRRKDSTARWKNCIGELINTGRKS